MNSTSRLCAPLAGPFHHLHNENDSAKLWISFSLISIVLTILTRRLVLGHVLRGPPTPTPVKVAPTPCPRCQHITDAELPPPPPVELPPPSSTKPPPTYEEILAADKKRLLVVPTTSRFIFCTILTLFNVTAIVLLAFDIQAFLYCGTELTAGTPVADSQQRAYAICMWIVYVCCVGWDLSGILCWMIWVRNLWGGEEVEEVAEKWPIRTDFGGIIIAGSFMAPFVLVFVVLMCVVRIPASILKAVWVRIRGKRVNVVEVGEMEKGIGCESGSVTEVESFTKK